jgi:flagellar biosynthetic protein FlhB
LSSWEQREQKTEDPTPRRLDKAREQGQVFVSVDLTVGLGLLAASLLLWRSGREMAEQLTSLVRAFLPWERADSVMANQLTGYAGQAALTLATTLGVVVPLASCTVLLVSLIQTRFNVSLHPLIPDPGRLSWSKGLHRLWSRRARVRGGFAIVKFAVLAVVAIWILRNDLVRLPRSAALAERCATAWDLNMKLASCLSFSLLALGVLDFLFQRSEHEADLRMTRQEVKEDHKESEGDPQIKARIRKIQRERSKKRMLADVPTATVIVRNPTHFAVALRYDRKKDPAPVVVAKGQDHLALTIIELGRKHDVPIVERREVARALYQHTEVGQEVPYQLFLAVAEVLNYIQKLRGRI